MESAEALTEPSRRRQLGRAKISKSVKRQLNNQRHLSSNPIYLRRGPPGLQTASKAIDVLITHPQQCLDGGQEKHVDQGLKLKYFHVGVADPRRSSSIGKGSTTDRRKNHGPDRSQPHSPTTDLFPFIIRPPAECGTVTACVVTKRKYPTDPRVKPLTPPTDE